MRKFSASVGAFLAIVLVAPGLASCAGSSSGELPPLPQKNIELWVLPLDEYEPMSHAVSEYAEGLIRKTCIVNAGLNFPLPEVEDFSRLPLPTENSVGRRLFDPTIAAEWGYHQAEYDDLLRWGGQEVVDATYTAADDAQFEKCSEERPESIPEFDAMADGLARNRSAAVWEEAIMSTPVVEAGEAWKACMAPLGISDLPEMPTGMLPQSLGSLTESPTPSVEEIRIAVADAECRESSEFSTTLYATEWDLQVEVLNEEADMFIRAKEVNAAYETALMEAVRNRGEQ